MTPRKLPGGESGFTIVETLIASAITLTLVGAVLALLSPAEGTFRAQPEVSDMQQRVRVSAEALMADLLVAGAGIDVGTASGPLIRYFAPVLPYRIGDLSAGPAAGVYFRQDAITLTWVPPTMAQTTLREAITADARQITVNTQPNCPPATVRQICGFEESMRLLLLGPGGIQDVVTVAKVENPLIELQYNGRLSIAYPAGSQVAQVETHTYYLKTNTASGISQLMRYDGHRSDLPLVDNVVRLQFRYFGDPQPPVLVPGVSGEDGTTPVATYGPSPPALGVDNEHDAWPPVENCTFAAQNGQHVPRLPALATSGLVELSSAMLVDGPWCPDEAHAHRFDADLFRVRRISVTLRVQAAAALLRGPAGPLFTRGGTSTSAERFVPDQEIHFDVAPRNMNAGR